MPWVNRSGNVRTRSGFTPPSGFTPEQVTQLQDAGWEWVDEVPLTTRHNPTTAVIRRREEYARRWSQARADVQIRQQAAAAREGQTLPVPAGPTRGLWVNEQGQRWNGSQGTRPPGEMTDEEADTRIAAGYRWVDGETWSHPTLRATFLRSFDQDGERAAARERIARRISMAVDPRQAARNEMWVNREGEVYAGRVGVTHTPEQLRAEGWHLVNVDPETSGRTTLDGRREAWLITEIRALLDHLNGEGSSGSYVWLDRRGFPHPTVRRADLSVPERRSLEDAGYRRVYLRRDADLSLAMLRNASLGAERTTDEADTDGTSAGAWIDGQGRLHHFDIPPHLATEALRAELIASGYLWVGGPDVRAVDQDSRREIYAEALRIERGEVRASDVRPVAALTPEAVPAYVEVPAPGEAAPPVPRLTRWQAWGNVQDALIEALAAVPRGDGVPPERRVIVATLGRLVHELGDHTIPRD